VTAAAYREVGGLEPIASLEDAAFEERLREHGIPVRRAGDVRVRTSARLDGRAGRGLAVDMAVAAVPGVSPPRVWRCPARVSKRKTSIGNAYKFVNAKNKTIYQIIRTSIK